MSTPKVDVDADATGTRDARGPAAEPRDPGTIQDPEATAARSAPTGAAQTDATLTALTMDDATRTAVTSGQTVAPPQEETTRTRRERRGPAQVWLASFGAGYELRGRYRLEQLIGEGAMGQVWRARDLLGEEAEDRNPFVAVKVLNSDVESHPDAFIALHREAARAQKLAHPNIVTVYVFDRDERSRRAFISMELLPGKPLDRVIGAAPGGVPFRVALPIIRGMAEGLAYAHRNGLVHSDFKPANVFLTDRGVPKILDFGIARAVQQLDAGTDADATATVDDSGFQGYTLIYAAPEVIAGDREPSKADDVFALGLVAYELLTGRHAFNRQSSLEALAAGLKPAPLRGVPRREARAIQRALSFERSGRQSDAAVFLRELQGVPLIQQALVAAVAVLLLAAAGLGYRSYLDSLPAEPLSQLPLAAQQAFREQIRLGNESLAYMRRTRDITASADAAEYFGEAYRLHRKDPAAVSGLKAAADAAIAWYLRQPDKERVRQELKKFRAHSEYYQSYGPLVRAIRGVGGP